MEITVEKVDTGVQKLGFQALSTLKTVRVAVYARVSTDQEIQLHSLEEQMKAFRAKIAQHPGWMLVDGESADVGTECGSDVGEGTEENRDRADL